MKLLFDQNLSRHLVRQLADSFPGSDHVIALGLSTAPDSAVWQYAKEHGFAVVSKDDDFNDLARLFGAPPKVIHVAIGNSTTAEVEAAIRSSLDAIRQFGASDDVLLVIGGVGL